MLKVCNHENLIKLVDLFETNENYYIVMEYIQGGDLFDYFKQRNFKMYEEHFKSIIY